ncbi:hypothetical protein NMY22_g11873 [Coprinellus aureogranulatus]|nr:hypothetical protein NMY22_g11873 [Coprinellus aureogranulatus]
MRPGSQGDKYDKGNVRSTLKATGKAESSSTDPVSCLFPSQTFCIFEKRSLRLWTARSSRYASPVIYHLSSLPTNCDGPDHNLLHGIANYEIKKQESHALYEQHSTLIEEDATVVFRLPEQRQSQGIRDASPCQSPSVLATPQPAAPVALDNIRVNTQDEEDAILTGIAPCASSSVSSSLHHLNAIDGLQLSIKVEAETRPVANLKIVQVHRHGRGKQLKHSGRRENHPLHLHPPPTRSIVLGKDPRRGTQRDSVMHRFQQWYLPIASNCTQSIRQGDDSRSALRARVADSK